ncbi:putative F-box protein At1g55070 [Papaver somniferum]|uniref:putative F-box protein At1g55070 n=1 Tax=Papaver somniferum TaxID=3469 RepID=UPI000E6F6737|nr:putative F-box protein At1g55070 [Papaver somniferum]
MENLPLEITVKILSGLPTDSQLQCREVCTTWRSFLPKPKKGLLYKVLHPNAAKFEAEFFFSEQNNSYEQGSCLGTLTKLDHSLIMPTSPAYKSFMVGSCKGLVCYASSVTRERIIYISNPVTGEEIQFPAICGGNAYSERAIGFGYSLLSNKYKVYTLEGDAVWRSRRRTSEKQSLSNLSAASPSAGVFACGTLYWMDEKSIKPKTVVFDLEDETFDLIPSIHRIGREIVCSRNSSKLLDETLKKLMDDCTPSAYTTTRATPYVNSIVSLKAIMEERCGKNRKVLEEIE